MAKTKPQDKKAKRKGRRQNLLMMLISTGIALFLGEMVLRWMLFSGGDGFQNLRQPEYYADISEDAYWKLYYEFGGEYQPPEQPHPLLGWIGYFDEDTYLHRDFKHLGKRRPVLLYGDSFAMCVDSVQCFEDILNADSSFTAENYLLNYGVGGYGVGQAALLCKATAPKYDRPLVIFSMLTTDIDRTILSVRTGQKPYFDLVNDELKLKGLPINPDPKAFFEDNGPGITSYLYRRFVYSDLNVLPYRIRKRMTHKDHYIQKKQDVNEALLQQVTLELRGANMDFVFMVFHFEDDMMSPKSEDNWRDQFFKRVIATDNQVPLLWTKGIIRGHRETHPENNHDAYIIPGNGHPTTLYNRLISEEIKRYARSEFPASSERDSLNMDYFQSRVADVKRQIHSNEEWYGTIEEKAVQEGRDVDWQIHLDAVFLVNEEMRKNRRSHGL